MKLMKASLLTMLLLMIAFAAYVMIVNRNSKQMTTKQKLLKAIYPMFMWWRNRSVSDKHVLANTTSKPLVPFSSLQAIDISGQPFSFSNLKGKKVLLVNTASDCGYTGQYEQLEQLYRDHKEKLEIIAFPANDFKEQEKGSDEEIAQFCKRNYGVTFPLMKKSSVRKGATQNEVFQWLTDSSRNGWNNRQPSWNFSKYLVDENGDLVNYFAPEISPLSDEVIGAIIK